MFLSPPWNPRTNFFPVTVEWMFYRAFTYRWCGLSLPSDCVDDAIELAQIDASKFRAEPINAKKSNPWLARPPNNLHLPTTCWSFNGFIDPQVRNHNLISNLEGKTRIAALFDYNFNRLTCHDGFCERLSTVGKVKGEDSLSAVVV